MVGDSDTWKGEELWHHRGGTRLSCGNARLRWSLSYVSRQVSGPERSAGSQTNSGASGGVAGRALFGPGPAVAQGRGYLLDAQVRVLGVSASPVAGPRPRTEPQCSQRRDPVRTCGDDVSTGSHEPHSAVHETRFGSGIGCRTGVCRPRPGSLRIVRRRIVRLMWSLSSGLVRCGSAVGADVCGGVGSALVGCA